MITFNTQEDFEKAVEAIICEKLRISAKTSMDKYYTDNITINLSIKFNKETISTCYFGT